MATQAQTKTKKKAAPPKVLNVAYVWDMSGSMSLIWEPTKEGTSGYLMDLQKEERKLVKKHGEGVFTRLSVTVFDTVFEQWLIDEPIQGVHVPTVINQYQPRGGTALYDAVANTIADLESRLADRKNEKCLVIVMTDGGENSSKEYSVHANGRERLFELIKSYEAKGNWTFVYLGANVDAYAEAAAIGIPQGNAAYYSATPDSVAAASASMTRSSSTLRGMSAGSSIQLFADSGLEQDYRDEDEKPTKLWTPDKK